MDAAKKQSDNVDHVQLDGIQYELRRMQQRSGYHVAWMCSKCQREVGDLPESTSQEQALDRAMANLISHHIIIHPTRK